MWLYSWRDSAVALFVVNPTGLRIFARSFILVQYYTCVHVYVLEETVLCAYVRILRRIFTSIRRRVAGGSVGR